MYGFTMGCDRAGLSSSSIALSATICTAWSPARYVASTSVIDAACSPSLGTAWSPYVSAAWSPAFRMACAPALGAAWSPFLGITSSLTTCTAWSPALCTAWSPAVCNAGSPARCGAWLSARSGGKVCVIGCSTGHLPEIDKHSDGGEDGGCFRNR